ncbi:prefolding complex chaperone subunit [Saccharomyces paradoxus]|uniref:Prefolding complex chaperone subunit n=1 Tax=Saccharomyces paradoxus TaxID=27291 RepID=A0A8B8UTM1_SACPA|nr:Pfd1 [Saccharomyces paradoxus]QHS74085.1 Pfd1 [Saccharomyces paradoxus]
MSQIAQEMTVSLRNARTQLDMVNQQLAYLDRQEKLAELTKKELESYPTDKVWRSCGKSFILQEKSKYVSDLSHDETVLLDQRKTLKIKKNYLETTVEKTIDNLKALMKN